MRASQRFLKGLIYFPLQTNILSNERIRVLMSDHGNDGFTCLILLWCQIYGNEYYKKFGPREMRLFCNDHKFQLPILESILETCFEEELFDAGLYNKFHILTSESIQEIWVDVTYRRSVLDVIQEYMIVKLSDIPKSRRVHIIDLTGKVIKHATDKDGKKILREEKIKVPKSEKKKKSKEKITPPVDIIETAYLMPEITDDHYVDEDLIDEVLQIFGLENMNDSTNRKIFIHFSTVLKTTEKLDKFRTALKPYAEYCKATHNRYRHKFENFIGHQNQRFEDGKWSTENWQQKLEAELIKPSHQNGHTKVVESKGEQAIESHKNFMKNFEQQ